MTLKQLYISRVRHCGDLRPHILFCLPVIHTHHLHSQTICNIWQIHKTQNQKRHETTTEERHADVNEMHIQAILQQQWLMQWLKEYVDASGSRTFVLTWTHRDTRYYVKQHIVSCNEATNNLLAHTCTITITAKLGIYHPSLLQEIEPKHLPGLSSLLRCIRKRWTT